MIPAAFAPGIGPQGILCIHKMGRFGSKPFYSTRRESRQGINFSMSKSFNSQSFTLTAGVAKLLAAQNLARLGLLLENNGGSNPVTFKFQTAPVSATDGFTLDPASATGGQGGTLLLNDPVCPIDSIWAYSAAGTTISIHEMTSWA
jgi:hypothetical protein